MGAAFSCSEDNDDLINVLKIHDYVKSRSVEIVFRAVDRGNYILETHRHLAYKDTSWKVGNIHLSAPCVYCRVMEGLSLKPGLSFLNIGSGTGYLSTMAGLILGENGTNHGIEMYEDCLTFANEHLEEFKKKSLDVDVFEFCEPVFQLGNFLNTIPNRQYDRVYCGAACPEAHEKFVKQFVKIGGILVMPYKDYLLRAERTGEKTWRNETMLPVSFASLMPPQDDADRCLLQLPLWKPRTLQELCRSSIRRHLRKMVWSENTNLEQKRPIKILSMNHSSPQLRSGAGIIDDANDPLEGPTMATTLQIVMSSAMRALLAGRSDGGIYVEPRSLAEDISDVLDRHGGTDSDDSLLSPFEYAQRVSSKETSNFPTHTTDESGETARRDIADESENEDSMDIESKDLTSTKEIQDVEMRENCEDGVKQGGSNYDRSSGSNMKRKRIDGLSNENSENSNDELPILSERSFDSSDDNDDDDDDDDDLDDHVHSDFVLIKKVCSMINPEKLQRIINFNGSSDTSSDDTSSDDDSNDDDDDDDDNDNDDDDDNDNDDDDVDVDKARRQRATTTTTRYNVKNSKTVDKTEKRDNCAITNDNDTGDSHFTRQLNSQVEQCRSEEIGSKKRVLSSYQCKKNDKKFVKKDTRNINSSNDPENVTESSDSSSDDETSKLARTNYRRDHRAGQKRRSAKKSVSSGINGASNCGKKTNESGNSTRAKNSSSSIGSGIGKKSSNEKKTISSVEKKSNTSECSASTSGENFSRSWNSMSTICSDSESESPFEIRKLKRKENFARTIRNDLFETFMKGKIYLLPLPPPLLLYMNYNREL